jgi:gamma-glutamyltranspeptidase
VFNVFGSMMLDPGTGILFNNRMQGFTHRGGKPNSVGPGRRPAHTLCPVLVRRGGRLRFALATPGGLSQTLTNIQVLSYLVDEGRDVAAAVEAPRWPQGRARRGCLFLRFRQSHRAPRHRDARRRRRLPAGGVRARLLSARLLSALVRIWSRS